MTKYSGGAWCDRAQVIAQRVSGCSHTHTRVHTLHLASYMRRIVISLLLLFATFTASARAQAAPDWNALADEALRTLSAYVRVNTTDPPGNELDAAKFLKAILDGEGIEAQILDTAELGPNRANLYARLRETARRRRSPWCTTWTWCPWRPPSGPSTRSRAS